MSAPTSNRRRRSRRPNGRTEDLDRACVGVDEPRQQAHRRRLARPVRTEESVDDAGRHGQVEAGQRRPGSVALRCSRAAGRVRRSRSVGLLACAVTVVLGLAHVGAVVSVLLRWLASISVVCPSRSFQRVWIRTSSVSPTSRRTTVKPEPPPRSIDSIVASVDGSGNRESTSPRFCRSSLLKSAVACSISLS